MHMHIGLPVLQLRFLAAQLRFLVAPCLACVCVTVLATVLAAGWRALAKPSSMLAAAQRAVEQGAWLLSPKLRNLARAKGSWCLSQDANFA